MENGTKLRLLYLYQHLINHTDADHTLSTPDLIRILKEQYDIEVNRNTLANDFSMLEKAGIHIEVIHSQQNKYYYDGQTFDIPELKILIDAVSSSMFITEKKSSELIEKILSLTNTQSAEKLRQHVAVEGRVKSENERGYYIVDIINEAIDRECKISFQYADYSPKKRKVLRHNGAKYIVSPYGLIWDGYYYYVIGYSETRGQIQNFRLDRIYRTPDLIDEPQVPKPKDLDLGKYAQTVFRMFDTDEPVAVRLQCKNHIMNGVIDHFGTGVKVQEDDKDHFSVFTKVCPSPTFYRWGFSWNGYMKILEPESVREEYREMCRKALESLE